ncbi:hypothetical protein FDJ23_gp026 [Erwinia phage vB_EamM_Desertfox]|uniref:Uncharacterized protein n=3 Tax=Agricanvirus TaxID=1984776 RepID=A0A191ZBR9_9CAUD|nr:hypothetical protein FDI00_gp026 [Erwinia phage vB_EamM_Special G]YP_009621767.1 hypothetical protein FDJ23_gp026 [Erwinia phage vB_EamM_Desertfox]ANJ64836.3 hypothetical protein SPECIALG_26 [Erwinia phage vB_EamM_Special G]AUG86134.1 hypothetical protein DESERTFOX_26 [Erwinia phage vB_EamM_Desertfox]AUG86454.1 hypothetical protein MADMEL_26 [Erwinia phage vB_EamM_MadMel]
MSSIHRVFSTDLQTIKDTPTPELEDSVTVARRIAMQQQHQTSFLILFKERARQCTDGFDKWRMDKTNNPLFEQTARQRLAGIAINIYQEVTGEVVSSDTRHQLIKWAEDNKVIIINHVVGMQLWHRMVNNTPAETQLQVFSGGRQALMFSFKIPGAKHPYLI